MITSFFSILLAAGPQGTGQTQQPTGGFLASPLFMILIFFAIFYFLMILPQQRKLKRDQEMRKRLKEGDRIITNAGIVGQIVKAKEKTLIIKTGGNTQIEILRASVAKVISSSDIANSNSK